ncbi:ETC complex I subunit [Polycladidibacter hongkongensis]|uniref:ETC complex I subunit n=1 Tax=Polycladidibacter hongkongensis TaxID=1647556 RepID=UPI000830B5B5|nr:ETC complex I subunit [Pseudovibrio hongkongensis]
MSARIYQPAKNAMQSGKAKSNLWLLDYDPGAAKSIDPLMGYTTSSDMQQQVRMKFSSKEEAVAFAERQGMEFRVIEPRLRKTRSSSYSDNFKHNRIAPWTH